MKYLDISFMEQVDQRFWDESGKMEIVSADLTLKIEKRVLTEECLKAIHGIIKNTPVKYKDGIFRVKTLQEETDEDTDVEGWRIELEGTFSSKDPNGIALNGWSDEETACMLARNVDGSIGDLEL